MSSIKSLGQCGIHGETVFNSYTKGKKRCGKCDTASTTEYRRNNKISLIEYRGADAADAKKKSIVCLNFIIECAAKKSLAHD